MRSATKFRIGCIALHGNLFRNKEALDHIQRENGASNMYGNSWKKGGIKLYYSAPCSMAGWDKLVDNFNLCANYELDKN